MWIKSHNISCQFEAYPTNHAHSRIAFLNSAKFLNGALTGAHPPFVQCVWQSGGGRGLWSQKLFSVLTPSPFNPHEHPQASATGCAFKGTQGSIVWSPQAICFCFLFFSPCLTSWHFLAVVVSYIYIYIVGAYVSTAPLCSFPRAEHKTDGFLTLFWFGSPSTKNHTHMPLGVSQNAPFKVVGFLDSP